MVVENRMRTQLKKRPLSCCLDWHRLGKYRTGKDSLSPLSCILSQAPCNFILSISLASLGVVWVWPLSHWITFFDGLLSASLYITDHIFMSIYVRPLTIIPAFPPALILLPYLQAGATSSLSLLFNRVTQQASAPLLPDRLQSPFIPQIPPFHQLRPKLIFSAAKMARAV